MTVENTGPEAKSECTLILPPVLVDYLNHSCTHRYICPADKTPPARPKRPMLITKDGENLEGVPANPELVAVTFVPRQEFMSQMENMRRIGNGAGIAIGKPNLTFHGERKLALLEAQGVSIDRALSNNLSEIKGR